MVRESSIWIGGQRGLKPPDVESQAAATVIGPKDVMSIRWRVDGDGDEFALPVQCQRFDIRLVGAQMGKLRSIVADMLIQEEYPQRFGRVGEAVQMDVAVFSGGAVGDRTGDSGIEFGDQPHQGQRLEPQVAQACGLGIGLEDLLVLAQRMLDLLVGRKVLPGNPASPTRGDAQIGFVLGGCVVEPFLGDHGRGR